MKNKKTLILAAIIGIPTVGWALADIFAAETMCKIDPTCRQLTDVEKDIATSVFGQELDTSKVSAVSRPSAQKAFVSLIRSYIPTHKDMTSAMTLITPPTLAEHNPEDEASTNAAYETVRNRKKLVHQLTFAAQSQFKIPHDMPYAQESDFKFENDSRNKQADLVGSFYMLQMYYLKQQGKISSPSDLKSKCDHLRDRSAEFSPYFKAPMPKLCSLKVK